MSRGEREKKKEKLSEQMFGRVDEVILNNNHFN